MSLILSVGRAPISRSASQAVDAAPAQSVSFGYLPQVDKLTAHATTRFAVIGDYGLDSSSEADVAALVARWEPDFVITTGDNNYPLGEASTIDQNIGQHYAAFIGNYRGQYGNGAATNRFFPALGNHDWYTGGAQPYLDYFTLPGNERYYDLRQDAVHLFALDSDPAEPDGITADSTQGRWLQQQLADSTACWKIVYMHHPPYSSGQHGSTPTMQWAFGAWGADAVYAGHDHSYERIVRDGVTYVVNGLGGNAKLYDFGTPVAGSQVRFNGDVGAMLVEATNTTLRTQFVTRSGTVIDTDEQHKECQ